MLLAGKCSHMENFGRNPTSEWPKFWHKPRTGPTASCGSLVSTSSHQYHMGIETSHLRQWHMVLQHLPDKLMQRAEAEHETKATA